MPEIRRIDVAEAGHVAALWDRMCRETPDGGPLTEVGRANIHRMLEIAAWHHQTFCLVAVEDGEVAGFVMGRLDPGDGLLPGFVGEVNESYAPGELRRQLVEAAVTRLRQEGANWAIRHLADADDRADQELFTSLGFEPDMVSLTLYADEC